jgi:thiol-disulfide isomerase/thioredoxin
MFTRPRSVTVALSLCLSVFSPALGDATVRAAEGRPSKPAKPFALMVGDLAPPLNVARWVRGGPSLLGQGSVSVIEIWATWCGPCVAGMPHLSELQERYRNRHLRVIGLTCPDDYGNTLAAVDRLIHEQEDKVRYTIAWDARGADPYLGVFKGKTIGAYLKGAGITGIPVAFVVDRNGRIAYIGHPMTLDRPLQRIMEGKWDLDAAAAEYRAQREAERRLPLFTELMKAGQYARAYPLARELLRSPLKEDPRSLVMISESIVAPQVAEKDLDLALSCALRAADLTGYRDPGMIDALARVHFVKGEIDQAIALVNQAIAQATGGQKAALQRVLAQYQSRKDRS